MYVCILNAYFPGRRQPGDDSAIRHCVDLLHAAAGAAAGAWEAREAAAEALSLLLLPGGVPAPAAAADSASSDEPGGGDNPPNPAASWPAASEALTRTAAMGALRAALGGDPDLRVRLAARAALDRLEGAGLLGPGRA